MQRALLCCDRDWNLFLWSISLQKTWEKSGTNTKKTSKCLIVFSQKHVTFPFINCQSFASRLSFPKLSSPRAARHKLLLSLSSFRLFMLHYKFGCQSSLFRSTKHRHNVILDFIATSKPFARLSLTHARLISTKGETLLFSVFCACRTKNQKGETF